MGGNSFVQNVTGRVVKYIKPVPRGAAKELVARVYDQAEKEFALVPPITLHSPSPEILAGVWVFTREAFVVGRAGRLDREIVAAAVSQINACPFCVEVHSAMLHGGGRHGLAEDLLREEDARQSANPLAQWALATRTPGAGVLAAPPFGEAEAPHVIGTAVIFHFINRMVNVFLDSSPSPVKAPLLKTAFGRIFGAVVGRRLISVEAPPGRSRALLPDAPLPPEFAWAAGNEAIAGAVASFAAAIEGRGERVLPANVREIVTRAVGRWNGEDPGLSSDWIDAALQPLGDRADRATARLALLTALASYRVDQDVVEAYRRHTPSDESLVAVTAWASLQAVERLSTWIGGTRSSDAMPAGTLNRSPA